MLARVGRRAGERASEQRTAEREGDFLSFAAVIASQPGGRRRRRRTRRIRNHITSTKTNNLPGWAPAPARPPMATDNGRWCPCMQLQRRRRQRFLARAPRTPCGLTLMHARTLVTNPLVRPRRTAHGHPTPPVPRASHNGGIVIVAT